MSAQPVHYSYSSFAKANAGSSGIEDQNKVVLYKWLWWIIGHAEYFGTNRRVLLSRLEREGLA
jgi:hypothetical protein